MPITGASPAPTAQDPASQFFASLAGRHLATFEGESATLLFDVIDGEDDQVVERWHLTVTNGGVTVTHRNGPADAVVRIRRPDFEAMVTGRLNTQAAFLRGVITTQGSNAALMMFQRCLPGPTGSTGRAAPITGQTVMAERRAT